MRSKRLRLLVAILLLAPLAVPALAEVQPLGSEFRVNRTNDFQQKNPVAAFAGSGAALVVWENDRSGIRGAFHRLDGTAVGAQITLVANEGLSGTAEGMVRDHRDPVVAFLPSGHFLLAWTEVRSSVRVEPFFEDRDVLDQDILVQRFDAAGAPAGPRHRVNATTTGFQSLPKLAVLPNGNALVVWQGAGLSARLVNGSGQPVGAEVKVTTDETAGHQAVAAGRNGFLVAWDAAGAGTSDVLARLFAASGQPDGPAFRVNAAAAGQQRWPAVAPGKNGDFLVAWQSFVADRAAVRIHGQFVSRDGGFLGSSFFISANEGPAKLAPALAPAKGGGFMAAWLDWAGLAWGIKVVELDSLGARVGDEVWASSSRVQKNYRTSIASDGKGGFLVPWETVANRHQVISARGLAQ
ncbi:MAG TPA: hypothetical protein VE685_21360 [Thermoanaerobaculia bacterium]|nr:hypothetical protein [Thermoanaerobaculia bacterium]